ncbi:hypothetical protein HK102_004049 [Quaeritorhiza haematococci]|nr:hypothetical protein HK102_004049 [Quaeritorhiza haematococci]
MHTPATVDGLRFKLKKFQQQLDICRDYSKSDMKFMKLHGLVRFLTAIPANGSPSSFDASVNEEAHKEDAKMVYRKTNHKNYELQMLKHLERRDKLLALSKIPRASQAEPDSGWRSGSEDEKSTSLSRSKMMLFSSPTKRATDMLILQQERPAFRNLLFLTRTMLDNLVINSNRHRQKDYPKLDDNKVFIHNALTIKDYDEDGDEYTTRIRSTERFHNWNDAIMSSTQVLTVRVSAGQIYTLEESN